MKKFCVSLLVILYLCVSGFSQNTPLQILEKPKAGYPDGSICATGVVRLRIEFLASGGIGKVSPVSALGYGLTESAIEAAKKIKFKPSTKNGLPITITKVTEFSFTIY